VWIKICGLTNLDAALACAEEGADAVGFVFAESRRKISVEKAKQIIRAMPGELQKVGVFVDASLEKVEAIQRYLELDLVQLHGHESPQYCFQLPVKVIKAFQIAKPGDLNAVNDYDGAIRACLLDSKIPGANGGTGQSWNWKTFNPAFLKTAAESSCFINDQQIDQKMKVIVAGGLNPYNVTSAIQAIKPDGIDVSSGVEMQGSKDRKLIRQFIETVRRWEQSEYKREYA